MSKTKKKLPASLKHLKKVQEHYEDYPYPLRDPEEEKTRLLMILGDYLGEINHWLFKGKKDFTSGFRVLIAGGGTGDSTIFLAEQLKDIKNTEVVYLDFSKASMEIAQKRAEVRGLTNIKWINDSILNIPSLKLGKFDYIQSTGVLHHLESPSAGLKILQQALTKDGGMSLMVYAQYGRTGVYQIQKIMQMVNNGVNNRKQETKNGWGIMNSLPKTNWFSRGEDLLSDHKMFGDIGLYDMFLHKQDRAYTIPELYQFVEDAGLNFVEFSYPNDRIALNVNHYIKDPELLSHVQKLPIRDQQAIAELMVGNIIKHSFFTSNNKDSIASFDDLDNVPYFYRLNQDTPKQFFDYLNSNPEHTSLKIDCPHGVAITLPVTKHAKFIFKHMSGNKNSFKDIISLVEKDVGNKIPKKDLLAEIKILLVPIKEAGILLLRDKSSLINNLSI
jgi:SAM-dependent methyltransferase